MERDNRAYRAALKEKDELLSQDGLLRMLYGEKPRRDAPAETGASSGDPFVVLIVAGAPNELEKHHDGIDSTIRSLLSERGVSPLLAHYNGQVLVLAQSPHLSLDAMEEASWELVHALASECETQSIRIYVSPVHSSRSEVHPAYLEALEAMRFEVLSAQSRSEAGTESKNGGVVLYGSLEMRTAHESIRRHLDETEENAGRAAGELDLLKAAEYCEELAVYEGGGDPSIFSTYRLIALSSSPVGCRMRKHRKRTAPGNPPRHSKGHLGVRGTRRDRHRIAGLGIEDRAAQGNVLGREEPFPRHARHGSFGLQRRPVLGHQTCRQILHSPVNDHEAV